MQKGNEKNNLGLEPKVINIFDRKKIDIVGVREVVSSAEKEIYVKLNDSLMHIVGVGLTILKLVPEEEVLSIAGQINGLNFISKITKKSLFGKVFK